MVGQAQAALVDTQASVDGQVHQVSLVGQVHQVTQVRLELLVGVEHRV